MDEAGELAVRCYLLDRGPGQTTSSAWQVHGSVARLRLRCGRRCGGGCYGMVVGVAIRVTLMLTLSPTLRSRAWATRDRDPSMELPSTAVSWPAQEPAVSELKIDRSFVMTMTEDPSNALIVRSVVDLGHKLGFTLVAEGVETEQILTALAGLDCDVAQGYHLSRPITVGDFDTWCAGRRIAASCRPAGVSQKPPNSSASVDVLTSASM